MREILKAAVVAGLIAGAVAALFHWVFTEPLIDRAVAVEEQSHPSHEGAEPVVSRSVQKLGLFAGFLLYGAAWGILAGLLIYATRAYFAETRPGSLGFFIALLLGWSVAIFPLLKYPANPPGVGEAETIGYRQEFFLLMIALSLVGAVAALVAERSVRDSTTARAAVLLLYAAYLAIVFAALPANPDPVKLAPDIVVGFRARALTGQILFWSVMGAVFWGLARRGDAAPS